MILKKVTIKSEISRGEYLVETSDGDTLTVFIKRKRLMNYVSLSEGTSELIIIPLEESEDQKIRFASRQDFRIHPELRLQKIQIEENTK